MKFIRKLHYQLRIPLSTQQKIIFAEKFLELANLALAGLVFTQLVQDKIRLTALLTGIILWLAIYIYVKVYFWENYEFFNQNH